MSAIGLLDLFGMLAGISLLVMFPFLRTGFLTPTARRVLLSLMILFLFGEAGDMLENLSYGEWLDDFTEYSETLLPLGWFIFLSRIVSDRKTRVLQESEERMRLLVESTQDIIMMQDLDGRYLYYNGPAHYGFLPEDVVGKTPYDIHDRATADDIMDRIRKVRDTGQAVTGETRMEIEGQTQYFLDQDSPILDRNGQMLGVVAICRNITHLKNTEGKLREALYQKEVLLREVHHRVKNNLQMISSILDLQAARSRDIQAVMNLRESQARLRAMSMIHERLYMSQDQEKIDFSSYARYMVAQLLPSVEGGRVRITPRLEMQEILLDSQVAIPLGLILHELISNTIKHAFPEGRAPGPTAELSLDLRLLDDTLVMEYGDNGVGMPPDFNPRTAGTLGMMLITSLVQQLHGQLDMKGDAGISCRISVPLGH